MEMTTNMISTETANAMNLAMSTMTSIEAVPTTPRRKVEPLPIDRKLNLTVNEAAEYSNIGINKLESMLRKPNCPFVLFVGAKKLVKRKQFEEYIGKNFVI